MAILPTVPPFRSNLINRNATNIFDLPNGDFGNPDAIITQSKLAYDKVSGKNERLSPSLVSAFQKYFASYLHIANIFERAAYNDYLINTLEEFDNVDDIPANRYPEAEKIGQYAGYHARLVSGLISKLGTGYVFNVLTPDASTPTTDMNVKFIWSLDAPSKLDLKKNKAIVSHAVKGDVLKNDNIFIAYEQEIISAIIATIGNRLNEIFEEVKVAPTEYVLNINILSILNNVTVASDGNIYFLSILNIQGVESITKNPEVVANMLKVATGAIDVVSTYVGY
jgi:hypothetical protein